MCAHSRLKVRRLLSDAARAQYLLQDAMSRFGRALRRMVRRPSSADVAHEAPPSVSPSSPTAPLSVNLPPSPTPPAESQAQFPPKGHRGPALPVAGQVNIVHTTPPSVNIPPPPAPPSVSPPPPPAPLPIGLPSQPVPPAQSQAQLPPQSPFQASPFDSGRGPALPVAGLSQDHIPSPPPADESTAPPTLELIGPPAFDPRPLSNITREDALAAVAAARQFAGTLPTIELQVDQFREWGHVVSTALDAVGGLHPIIQGAHTLRAVGPESLMRYGEGVAHVFKIAMQFELRRKENDRRVLVVKIAMIEMVDGERDMCAPSPASDVRPKRCWSELPASPGSRPLTRRIPSIMNIDDPQSLSLGGPLNGRLRTIITQASTNIRDCSEACDTYINLKYLSASRVKSSFYPPD